MPSLTASKKKDKDGNVVLKQKLINDYNLFMGGVDKNDAVISTYSCVRKSHKWTTKIFFHFLEEAIYNAFIIFKNFKGNITYCNFKTDIIRDMLSYDQPPKQSTPAKCGRHFPERIPSTQKKGKPTKRCIVCYKKNIRKESSYQCGNCVNNPGLCIDLCFREHHT